MRWPSPVALASPSFSTLSSSSSSPFPASFSSVRHPTTPLLPQPFSLLFILCVSSASVAASRRIEAPPRGYLAALLPSQLNHSVYPPFIGPRLGAAEFCYPSSASFPRVLHFLLGSLSLWLQSSSISFCEWRLRRADDFHCCNS